MKTNRIIQYSAFGSKKIYFEYYTSALNKIIWLNHTQLAHPDITTELQEYTGYKWHTSAVSNNGKLNFVQQ